MSPVESWLVLGGVVFAAVCFGLAVTADTHRGRPRRRWR